MRNADDHATDRGDSRPQPPQTLTPAALAMIDRRVRRLIGQPGYSPADLEDLRQELALDLLERLGKFDPSRASYRTFIARLIERKISNLRRNRGRQRRNIRRQVGSLDDVVEFADDGPVLREETIDEERTDRWRPRPHRPSGRQIDLQVDLAAVLAGLPPHLQEAARLLGQMSICQAAEQMGISHGSFYRKYLAPLRDILEARGFRTYLP